MNLSDNFTLKELTVTNTGLKNEPGVMELDALRELVNSVLQPARERMGIEITVTSGFRSKLVNSKVGGASDSQHQKGEAADLQCVDNKRLFDTLKKMEFDQLIWEHGTDNQPAWVHVSYRKHNNRGQVLRAVKQKGKTVYHEI